jgi:hypothetical protein
MKSILKAAVVAAALFGTQAVLADDTGVAAGSKQQGMGVATGQMATIVALGTGTAAAIGAIIAGSTSNGTTSTVSTTSTTH